MTIIMGAVMSQMRILLSVHSGIAQLDIGNVPMDCSACQTGFCVMDYIAAVMGQMRIRVAQITPTSRDKAAHLPN